MNAQRAKAVEKIKKLLALAVDQSDKPEGRVAFEQAEWLREEFSVDSTELHSDTYGELHLRFPDSSWARGLAKAVAFFLGTAVILKVVPTWGSRKKPIGSRLSGGATIAGDELSVDLTIALFASLIEQLKREEKSERVKAAARYEFGGEGPFNTTAYRNGFVEGVYLKILALRASVAARGGEEGLVRSDDRSARALKRYSDDHGGAESTKARGSELIDEAGVKAGQRASLTPPLRPCDEQRALTA